MYNFLVKKPKRAWQKMSHEVKFDTGFGSLVPILCEEILPHDTIKLSSELFTRFSALISPAFQRCDARIEYFFVPNRLLWDDWEKFISGQEQNQQSQNLIKPYVDLQDVSQGMVENSIFDYLGFPVAFKDANGNMHYPTNVLGEQKVDIMPFRAYYKIWYDWYRDENLPDNGGEPRSNGGKIVPTAEQAIWYLQSRAYPRDYFTSALPYAQGGEVPRIPLNYPSAGSTVNSVTPANGDLNISSFVMKADSTNVKLKFNHPENIVQGPTVEELRRTSAIQRWLEKNIRFGTRYVESVASHFGIRPQDYRLDRAEYLGGGKVNVRISEVLQTSESATTPLGEDGGHAIASGAAVMRDYTSHEHGFLIGLLSFVPKASYGQGWPRKFNRWSVTDYAFPEFDNLGEQPLYNQEIWAYGSNGSNVFGYKPRFDEYKHSFDRYCGQFRSNLAFWHLGRIFAEQPTLSGPFIYINDLGHNPQSDPDRLTRMFATDDTRNIICDMYHHLYIKRALSKGEVSVLR